jgi:hypothetical protein
VAIVVPPNSPSSQSPGAGTIGQLVADVPSGPSLDSCPHYANVEKHQYHTTEKDYFILIITPLNSRGEEKRF